MRIELNDIFRIGDVDDDEFKVVEHLCLSDLEIEKIKKLIPQLPDFDTLVFFSSQKEQEKK